MTVMNRTDKTTHTCLCSGIMIPKVGTIIRVIQGHEIRIHDAPYYECISCGEKEFDLSSRVSTIAVEAYRRGLSDVHWTRDLFRTL